jgi:uncharacterized protein (DUF1501 family)
MLIKRRSVLQGIAGAACTPLFLKAFAAEAAAANDTIVVAVGLNGGNDGLNTVIPLKQYAQYFALRTPPQGGGATIAFPRTELAATTFDSSPATAASHATEFAFAPTMTAMRQLYATERLAVIVGIGLPYTETAPLSHFNGWSDWSTGQINVDAASLPAGWLGATLDGATVGALGPTASMSGGQLVTSTATGEGLVVNSPSDFNLWIPWNLPQFNLGDAFQTIVSVPTTTAASAKAQQVTNATVNAVGAMQGFSQLAGDYPQPSSNLGWQLYYIAQMILGGAGIRGYAAVTGSYDTHSSQNDTHPGLVSDLSTALQQFYGYLKKKNRSKNVVIVTISDFGRTPAANLSLGTDHGAASVAFVLGDRVKGGVYGDYPSLKHFDVNGNLTVKIDFRNMLSDIIHAMGGNPSAILGTTFPRIGFI